MEKYHYIPRRLYEVTPFGCWEWKGRYDKRGRPVPNILGQPMFRFFCRVAHGPPPDESYHAAHTCHNRRCICPDHAEWQPPEQNNPTKGNTPYAESSVHDYMGVSFRIKERTNGKGNGRSITGPCAAFRFDGKNYKSGAYYHEEGAIRWAKGKIDALLSYAPARKK